MGAGRCAGSKEVYDPAVDEPKQKGKELQELHDVFQILEEKFQASLLREIIAWDGCVVMQIRKVQNRVWQRSRDVGINKGE